MPVVSLLISAMTLIAVGGVIIAADRRRQAA